MLISCNRSIVMNFDKLLTIVIPAYNMHDYLRRCLDSICIESVMNDVQVIVVNDGSTDDTLQIMHEYEHRYPHYIQVIDKENGNYGSCMNAALPLVEGKYFRTLDADDWYDSDALVRFIKDLWNSDADLVFSAMTIHRDLLSSVLSHSYFGPSIPAGIDLDIDSVDWESSDMPERTMGPQFLTYRTEVLQNVGMRWTENIFYTDTEYMAKPLRLVHKVRFFNTSIYQYQQGLTGQSMNSEVFSRNIRHHLLVCQSILLDFLSHLPYTKGQHTLSIMRLKVWIAGAYRSLYRNGFTHYRLLSSIDDMVQHIPELDAVAKAQNEFNGHYYVLAFRHNRLWLLFIWLEFLLKSNSYLRKLLKKA